MPLGAPANCRCEIILSSGGLSYEGILVRLDGPSFTAHLRETPRPTRTTLTGRRLPEPRDNWAPKLLKRSFRGRFKECPKEAFEVELLHVQRSTGEGFVYYVSGRILAGAKSPALPNLDLPVVSPEASGSIQ